MAFMFEKLKVYQKAVDLADQLNRAALSVAADLAESLPRAKSRAQRPFHQGRPQELLRHRRGSVQECVPLLELARRRALLDDAAHSKLRGELEEIARMLGGLILQRDGRGGLTSRLQLPLRSIRTVE